MNWWSAKQRPETTPDGFETGTTQCRSAGFFLLALLCVLTATCGMAGILAPTPDDGVRELAAHGSNADPDNSALQSGGGLFNDAEIRVTAASLRLAHRQFRDRNKQLQRPEGSARPGFRPSLPADAPCPGALLPYIAGEVSDHADRVHPLRRLLTVIRPCRAGPSPV